MPGTESTAPSSLNREPLQPAALPRIGQNYKNNEPQGANDFSAVLNNNDLVFGGDRPSNLNQRNKDPPPQSARASVAPMDYNYRGPMANENFSFPSSGGQEAGSGPGPSNYLNQRMQY